MKLPNEVFPWNDPEKLEPRIKEKHAKPSSTEGVDLSHSDTSSQIVLSSSDICLPDPDHSYQYPSLIPLRHRVSMQKSCNQAGRRIACQSQWIYHKVCVLNPRLYRYEETRDSSDIFRLIVASWNLIDSTVFPRFTRETIRLLNRGFAVLLIHPSIWCGTARFPQTSSRHGFSVLDLLSFQIWKWK